MMRGILVTVLIVAVVAGAFVLIQSGAFNPQPTPSPTPSLTASSGPTSSPTRTSISTPLPTPSPSPTPVDTSVVASGVVVPLRSAELAARATGIVATVYVHESSAAFANQLLLKLDQSTYQAAIDLAEASVGSATAAVEQAQLQLDQLPPDASPGQVEFVQATLRVAQAQLAFARTTLSGAQSALLQTEVRAPFAGTIADVNVEVGEQAIAGQTMVTIGDISGWLIETTDLSELEITPVLVGDRATVTFDAFPDLVLDGTVDSIQVRGRTTDGSVVYAVSIRPDRHNPDLRWGMTATVRISPSR
jgi:RND family efflux transporter MFP subunit